MGGGSAISYLPFQASNYLVLDAENNPNVRSWIVQIQEPIFKIGEPTIYRTIERIEIHGTYFSQIDSKFSENGDLFITVTGTGANGDIIVEEGPVPICTGCPSTYNACQWKCVGSNYAYSITLSVDDNGQNGLLTVAPTSNGAVPYYEYMSPTQFADLDASDLSFYNVSSWNYLANPVKIVKLTGVPTGTYSNAQNSPITSSTVYGVQKFIGPWVSSYANMSSPTNLSEADCNQNFGWALSQIFEPSGTPSLTCNGSSGGTSGGNPPPSSGEIELPEPFEPCIDAFDEYLIVNSFEPFPDQLFTLGWWYVGAQELFDCISGVNNSPSWPEEIAYITIAPYGNSGNEVVLSEATVYSPNGEFIGPKLDFLKGLYWTTIQFTNCAHRTIFFEALGDFTSAMQQADFLDVTVFPVPIIGDEFNIHLQATATVKFEYFLYDFDGNTLFRRKYVLHKDHEVTRLISPSGNTVIPNGQLVNKFVFEDGSEIVFQTIK